MKELDILLTQCVKHMGKGLLRDGRKIEDTYGRSVFCKIASEITNASPELITSKINRKRATYYNSVHKIFNDEISLQQTKSAKKYYRKYTKIKDATVDEIASFYDNVELSSIPEAISTLKTNLRELERTLASTKHAIKKLESSTTYKIYLENEKSRIKEEEENLV